MNRGWEASEKGGALNGCYPESSATVIMMVSAKSRLSRCPFLSCPLLLTLGEVREGLCTVGENHASLPPPMLLLEEKGKHETPGNSLQIIIPFGLNLPVNPSFPLTLPGVG